MHVDFDHIGAQAGSARDARQRVFWRGGVCATMRDVQHPLSADVRTPPSKKTNPARGHLADSKERATRVPGKRGQPSCEPVWYGGCSCLFGRIKAARAEAVVRRQVTMTPTTPPTSPDPWPGPHPRPEPA